jgi:threonine dehydratase
MKAALAAGERVTLDRVGIFHDGVAVRRVGEETFRLAQKYVDEIVTVSEQEIAQAILVLIESEKSVTEGSGAVGVAAVLNGKVKNIAGKNVGVVLTGGNIDTTFLSKVLERGLAMEGRLAKLVVIVPDRPESIAQLAAIASAEHANILDIHQRRTFNLADVRETEIEMVLETRGPQVVKAMLAAITQKGYEARSFEFE